MPDVFICYPCLLKNDQSLLNTMRKFSRFRNLVHHIYRAEYSDDRDEFLGRISTTSFTIGFIKSVLIVTRFYSRRESRLQSPASLWGISDGDKRNWCSARLSRIFWVHGRSSSNHRVLWGVLHSHKGHCSICRLLVLSCLASPTDTEISSRT